MIGFANWLSQLALESMSLLEKRHSISEQKYSTALNVAAISFLNLGVMVLLVNQRIEQKINFPILQGRYAEFSVEWYRLVGASLCVQLALAIVSGVGESIFAFIYNAAKRCYDRGFTMKTKKTRQLTQEEYENINFGTEISFEGKYSAMLVIVLMAMMYGPGLPIMYLIAACYFFVTYWSDKIMIFYNHRKPLYFDE